MQELQGGRMWNPSAHSDEDNLRWSWLRAVEWAYWPSFISQPIVPILLKFLPWPIIVLGLVTLNILWAKFISHQYVNVSAAYFAPALIFLKWFVCPVMAYYFYSKGAVLTAAIALLWPLAISVIDLVITILHIVPTPQIGTIQRMFMAKLGYQRQDG